MNGDSWRDPVGTHRPQMSFSKIDTHLPSRTDRAEVSQGLYEFWNDFAMASYRT